MDLLLIIRHWKRCYGRAGNIPAGDPSHVEVTKVATVLGKRGVLESMWQPTILILAGNRRGIACEGQEDHYGSDIDAYSFLSSPRLWDSQCAPTRYHIQRIVLRNISFYCIASINSIRTCDNSRRMLGLICHNSISTTVCLVAYQMTRRTTPVNVIFVLFPLFCHLRLLLICLCQTMADGSDRSRRNWSERSNDVHHGRNYEDELTSGICPLDPKMRVGHCTS
jgi:hypothetical protein